MFIVQETQTERPHKYDRASTDLDRPDRLSLDLIKIFHKIRFSRCGVRIAWLWI